MTHRCYRNTAYIGSNGELKRLYLKSCFLTLCLCQHHQNGKLFCRTDLEAQYGNLHALAEKFKF